MYRRFRFVRYSGQRGIGESSSNLAIKAVIMIYVEVECPECNEVNQIDEKLKRFFCLNCGVEVEVELEAIFEPGDDAPKAPGIQHQTQAGP